MYGKAVIFKQKQLRHMKMPFWLFRTKIKATHIRPSKNGEKSMERNFRNSQGYMLESQIREAFGKVTYSETCHDKFINRTLKLDDRIKVGQIVLSGITTSGFVVTIFSDDKIASIIGAVFSVGLLILNTYTKNFNLSGIAQEHKKASITAEV